MTRWPVHGGGDFIIQAGVGGAIVLLAGATALPLVWLLGPEQLGWGIAWLMVALALGAWVAWRVTQRLIRQRAEGGPFVELEGDSLRVPQGRREVRTVRVGPGLQVSLGWWSMTTPFPGQPSVTAHVEGVVLRLGAGPDELVLYGEDGAMPGRVAGAERVPSPLGVGVPMFSEDVVEIWKAVRALTAS